MWDIPDWLTTMDSLKYLLTGTGTWAMYLALAVAIVSQMLVVLFGVYKVREMFLKAED